MKLFGNILKCLIVLLFASNAIALEASTPATNATTIGTGTVGVAAIAVPKFCGQPMTVQLLAGQTNGVGTVTVQNNSNGYIYVTYKTIPGVTISETHLAVATSLAGIPQTPTGNPKNGQFPYGGTYNPPVNNVQFVIKPGDPGYPVGATTLYIAAHAVVNITSGTSTNTETAWGKGQGFPGKNWAMYFVYTIQPCTPPPPPPSVIKPGDFRTQTQGAWEADCHGSNSGCYLGSKFSSAFPGPDYLMVGGVAPMVTGYKIKFTSAADIKNFLPQGGTPGVLLVDATNPTTTNAGVLAGQVVTLTLNVKFDQFDPSFGASPILLKDLIVNDNTSACYNMTVQQVLDAANLTLSNTGMAMAPAIINDCVDKINNNFDNGTVVGTYLRLP